MHKIRMATASAFALAAVAATAAVTTPAGAETTGTWYHQQGRTGGGVASAAHFGGPTDTILVGDWNKDGKDTLAVRRGNEYHVTNSPAGGATAYSFRYGAPGDVVLVGDWNGDGIDTLGVRRGNTYYLTDAVRGGVANRVFRYGNAGDVILLGDWNGDNRDTLGVRRGNTYYFTNTQGGVAQIVSRFGNAGDVVIDGDWNGDRKDTLGIRRGNEYHLTNRVGGGATDLVERFGAAEDSLYIGDWNGDRVDTLAVRRAEGPPPPPRSFAGSGAYRVPGQVPPGLYRSSAGSAGCYWERVSDFSGSFESVIANYFGFDMSPIYARVKYGDAGFYTEDCGTWTEVTSADPVKYLPIDNGQYWVNHDMRPGRYQAPGGQDCYWALLDGFSGEFEDLRANGLGDSSPIVDVSSDVTGFHSEDCGTWTRIGEAARTAPRTVTVAPDSIAGARARR